VYGYQYDGDVDAHKGRTYAYVGVDLNVQRGMAIFDITHPANPVHLGQYASGVLRDVEVHDGIGYFSGSQVTHIVDLRADPVNPPLLVQVGGSHEFHVDVNPSGSYLYVDNFAGTVTVYDVTSPRNPDTIVQKATIATKGGHSVFAQDGRAYVANLSAGELAVYDVSDIQNGNVRLLTEFATGGGGTHGSWPAAGGDLLYVAHESGGRDLRVFDLSGSRMDENTVTEIVSGRFDKSDLGAGSVGNVHNLFVLDDVLYTSWTDAGMAVFDIRHPESPQLLGTFDTSATNTGGHFSGAFGVYPGLGLDRVLISDRNTGLWIVDVAQVVPPAAPPELQAGDADMDLDFDQLDLVKVQAAGKYLTAGPATWGEGDWNGAPGGSPGNPPLGDGAFNQGDIIAALQAGVYLTGPYAAVQSLAAPRPLDVISLPEPPTFLLTLVALAGLAIHRRHKQKPPTTKMGIGGWFFDIEASNNPAGRATGAFQERARLRRTSATSPNSPRAESAKLDGSGINTDCGGPIPVGAARDES
jgi:hypothetical protein